MRLLLNLLPLAYFLTFTCYGSHLHGSQGGSVDKRNGRFRTPMLPVDGRRERYCFDSLHEPPFELNVGNRALVLETIIWAAKSRSWIVHSAHVRVTHVHAVVSANISAERVLSYLKARDTQALRSQPVPETRKRYWTHHGSTRYLWNEKSLVAANEYVIEGQGRKLAWYSRIPLLCSGSELRISGQ